VRASSPSHDAPGRVCAGRRSRSPARAAAGGLLAALAALALLAAGCATVPTGPSVLVLPGDSKDFDTFTVDDAICRDWAASRLGIDPGTAAADAGVRSAAIGTGVGAAAGAAIGAASGEAAEGAAIGAGTGLLAGSAYGLGYGREAGWDAQERYDGAYLQCMYAKGNQVPMAPGAVPTQAAPRATPPPPPRKATRRDVIPPPPRGAPPPPPPDAG